MMSNSPWCRAILMCFIAATSLIDAIILAAYGIRVDPGLNFGTVVQISSLLILIGFTHFRPAPILISIRDIFILSYLFAGISLAGALAQYWIAGSTEGYYDSIISSVDKAIGFDWLELYLWTSSTPWAIKYGKIAYMSFFITPFLTIAILIYNNNPARAERYVLSHAIGLTVTLMIFAMIPTQCALSYYVGNHDLYRPVTDMTYINVLNYFGQMILILSD